MVEMNTSFLFFCRVAILGNALNAPQAKLHFDDILSLKVPKCANIARNYVVKLCAHTHTHMRTIGNTAKDSRCRTALLMLDFSHAHEKISKNLLAKQITPTIVRLIASFLAELGLAGLPNFL